MQAHPLIFDTAIAKDKPENIRHPHNACPFCDPQQLTDILAQDADRIWLMNKFPTLQATWQTIIIESAAHDGDISLYSPAQNQAVFAFALKHWQAMMASDRFESVLLYKNFGPHSGGSLRHPHMQIVGLTDIDGYINVRPANLTGYPVITDGQIQITVSDQPIMGFVEINVTAPLTAVSQLADAVQQVVGVTVITCSSIRRVHKSLLRWFHCLTFHHIISVIVCRKLTPLNGCGRLRAKSGNNSWRPEISWC